MFNCNKKELNVQATNKQYEDTIKYSTKRLGNKFENLLETKSMITPVADVHYDIGLMFTYQAMVGVLPKLNDNLGNKLYLDSYLLNIDALKEMKNMYKAGGKGVRFDFVPLSKNSYYSITHNISPTQSDEFLYILATPIDKQDRLDEKHYTLFNLKDVFKLDSYFVNDSIFKEMKIEYNKSQIYNIISNYSNPKKCSQFVYYTWSDIDVIIQKKDRAGNLYKQVEFELGEVIPYLIISNKIKQYALKETDYKNAFESHEKQITIVGKYLPDTSNFKQDYFDMGTLYP